MATQILIWWVAVQLLGLAGLPLASILFRALPDRGYAFSKTLGLLLTGYLAWLVAMLGLASFGPVLIVLAALTVAIVGLLAVRRRPAPVAAGSGNAASLGITAAPAQSAVPLFALRETLVPWLRKHWRMVVGYELLFLLALVFLALLRSYDLGFTGPNPWGTERPMDYALFNAIRRSTTFPPHDPWLAGYSINYYYLGYLLMATVALISGLEPPVAYNMSLALIFALTALGVAGIVANLIALTLRDERRATKDEPEDQETSRQADKQIGKLPVYGLLVYRSSLLRVLAVVLAVILVLFAGNQGGALQIITGTNMAVALDGGDLARAIVNGLGARAPLTLDPPFKGDYFDGTSVITPTDTTQDFNWWNSSRAVWDDFTRRGDPTKHYTITEFPFFSFWLGDMHPHVMALPFGLLALALALQTLARPAAPNFTMGRRGWLELVLTGIVLGSLYMINSWDFPTYVLLFLGALLLLYVRLGRVGATPTSAATDALQARFSRVWWRHYASQAIVPLLASVVLFAPFYLTFRSLIGGQGFPLGLVTWSRTPLHSFLIIFGLFLLPLLAYVFAQGHERGDKETSEQGDTETGEQGDTETSEQREKGMEGTTNVEIALSPDLLVSLSAYLPWATLAFLIIGPLVGFPLLALLPLALYAALLAVEHVERPATAFVLWAFALACLICLGTDIVYIRDTFGSRLNTIFKFYYQAWLIWGLLAGYALWWLMRSVTQDAGRRTQVGGKAGLSAIGYRLSAIVAAVLFVLLLLGALVYPTQTAGRAFREGQRVGLAGKTPREQTPDGAAAIAWLRANAPADAVVLEAVGDAYDVTSQGFGGVSASTGLATVLGWPGHEDQWRGGDANTRAQIDPRKADVATIYSTTDVDRARELLQKYKVSYIYIGAAEHALYAPEGLAKLSQLGTPVFQQGDVLIYQVSR